jgi:lysophospholipase L1-like esterase
MMGRLCHGGLSKTIDVAVVHIGTNNLKLTQNDTATTIASKIFHNVKYIRSKNPKTRIVLASIFKRTSYEEKRKDTNKQLWNLFSSYGDSMITFTTSGETLAMSNTTDGLHPTPAGWRQVYDSGLGQHVRKALALSAQ